TSARNATIAAPTTAPVPKIQPRLRRAPFAKGDDAVIEGDDSALAKLDADDQRSAGNFSSPRSTAASTCGGTVGRFDASDTGVSVIVAAITACGVGPTCGGRPASISYVTHARA